MYVNIEQMPRMMDNGIPLFQVKKLLLSQENLANNSTLCVMYPLC